MKSSRAVIRELISRVSKESWKPELEIASAKYHFIAAWVAAIFDPIFAITDYINIPENWEALLFIRLGVGCLTLSALLMRKRLNIPSYIIALIPFTLISLQNAFTYSLIGNEDLLGHNLNYMALLIGASLFVLWPWTYSVVMILVSIVATAFFLSLNRDLNTNLFFLQGGLLLITAGIFMVVLIQTRYNLNVKEIKARLALKTSNEEIQSQAEEIKGINENLEAIVQQRTSDLEKKNRALEEYAFINAHQLRSPVASILGLINLIKKTELSDEARTVVTHLEDSTEKLDAVVSTITKAIERGETNTPGK